MTAQTPKNRLGIISALYEEQQGLVDAMQGSTTLRHGMRQYTEGKLWGIDAVCVLSRIGKVAAATTATMLIERFGVTHIIFTGVAGAGNATVKVGDIVVAESLVQYDLDTRPLFPQFEVPLTGLSHFESDSNLSTKLTNAARDFINNRLDAVIAGEERSTFKLENPRIHRGLIGSADQFANKPAQLMALHHSLPGLLAVEMEGAAVAQVCFELGVPFGVIRAISDNANSEAATDFMHFVRTIAARYAFNIVKGFCENEPFGKA
ncbi:MAG: 5'-methylthioadenosine/adenosylhomocysteine nucleosidase [Pseudomonadota bacterium]